MTVSDSTIEAIQEYRRARDWCLDAMRREFPIGTVVYRSPCIWGVVHDICSEWPDHVAIYHENRNVWWKPVELWERVDDKKRWPQWVRRYLFRRLQGEQEMRNRTRK